MGQQDPPESSTAISTSPVPLCPCASLRFHWLRSFVQRKCAVNTVDLIFIFADT